MYVVKPDNTRSRKTRKLHRNLLLPFMSILYWHTEEEDLFNAVEESQVDVLDIDCGSDVSLPISDAEILSDTDLSSLESVHTPPSPRYRIPQKNTQSTDMPIPDTQSP